MQNSTPSARQVVALLVGLALLVGACGSGNEGAEASETTTRATIEAVPMSLTFDGESCTFEGPSELTAASVELTFFNQSENVAAMNFLKHLDGYTIDDAFEYGQPWPTSKHHPSWTIEQGSWKGVVAGESWVFSHYLTPGIYHMVCARTSPLAVWFGTGLTVEG